jgi:uncharacterized protein YbbC (DUF1343 family)
MRAYSFYFLFLIPLILLACTPKPVSRKTVPSPAATAPVSAEATASTATVHPPATTVSQTRQSGASRPVMGAEQMNMYLPALKGKRVAMVVNHTSMVGNTHLVDTLLSGGIAVKKIFAPEHGFRGEADAGEHVSNSTDRKTGLPLISLYGSNKKPTAEQLKDVDVVVFDIQDVGVRFYTYISTMHYVMEACAENGKQLVVLDRPNPNGHYFDGPVLKPQFKSFVGMHPVPVVHGLTVGELANMINGEGWLTNKAKCELQVVKAGNYTHQTKYVVPVRPSPNLPNEASIRLYPSICFFEAAPVSVGRGTPYPFQVIGGPNPRFGSFTFTPVPTPGAKTPPLQGQLCYGLDLRNEPLNSFTLRYVIDFYDKAENPEKFYNSFFDKLAGTDELRKQIAAGLSEAAIRKTWQADLDAYGKTRKKYLLYAE